MTMAVTSDNTTADYFRSHIIFYYKVCYVTQFFIWSRMTIVFVAIWVHETLSTEPRLLHCPSPSFLEQSAPLWFFKPCEKLTQAKGPYFSNF